MISRSPAPSQTKLWRKLFRPADRPASPEPANPLLTLDRLEAYQPLLDLQDKRQLLAAEAETQGGKAHYQTMIVSVDFVSGTLFLDTFTPAATPAGSQGQLREGDTLMIRHHLNGSVLTLRGRLKWITSGPAPLYAMELPREVGYQNRRLYPRWEPNAPGAVQIRLTSPHGTPWYTQVVNLSAGGARIRVGGNQRDLLQRGLRLSGCQITLETGLVVQCQAVVKAYDYSRRPYAHTAMSLMFEGLNFQQRLHIQQYVNYQLGRIPAMDDMTQASLTTM